MATESDLRDLLRGPDPEGPAIDLDSVLRRSRTRRRPRVIAAQAVTSLALVAVVGVPALIALPPAADTSSVIALDAAEDADSAAGSELQSAPGVDPLQDLRRAGECGEPPVILPMLGWEIDVLPVAADPSAVAVSVTLRNDDVPLVASGTATVTGVMVVADGVVVGHAFPDATTGPVDLAPSESITWQAVAPFVGCEGSPAALPAGDFQISVDVEFLHDGTEGLAEPIRSGLVAGR